MIDQLCPNPFFIQAWLLKLKQVYAIWNKSSKMGYLKSLIGTLKISSLVMHQIEAVF